MPAFLATAEARAGSRAAMGGDEDLGNLFAGGDDRLLIDACRAEDAEPNR